jgi:16S rRNA (guanine527-N7)-methyltransferase
MIKELSDIIEHGAKSLGISLPDGAAAAFAVYYAFLEQKRKHVNLTAITGCEDAARLHFLDSLALLCAADFRNARVIDVGSGAGFPGMPLKLAEPSLVLTLLDATGKRVAFLSDLCEALGVGAVCGHACAEDVTAGGGRLMTCIHARAEEAAREHSMRGRYDIAVSRAVARLNVLCELCLPFVSVGGVFLAMKGADSAEELDEALGAVKILGAEYTEKMDYTIQGTDITRSIIIIRKISETPDEYPRRFPKIQKSPL